MLRLIRIPASKKENQIFRDANEILKTEGMGKEDRREPTEYEMKHKTKGWHWKKVRT